MVGKSGAVALRRGVVTASARTSPDTANGQVVVMLSIATSMLLLSMLFTTSAVLRNGTWIILVCVASWNMTDERCDDVPMPEDPKFNLPSFSFRYSMN